jgi:uncharacterized membrane protein (UPF0127 family)
MAACAVPADPATMVALSSIDDAPGNERRSRPRRIRRAKQGLASVVRIHDESGEPVCSGCVVVESTFKRMRGLLGSDGLDAGTGMLINPAPSVHTFFMRFPIDVVFIGREKTIVGISHNVKPWRITSARKAVAALELPTGTAAASGLEIGQTLTIVPANGATAA